MKPSEALKESERLIVKSFHERCAAMGCVFAYTLEEQGRNPVHDAADYAAQACGVPRDRVLELVSPLPESIWEIFP